MLKRKVVKVNLYIKSKLFGKNAVSITIEPWHCQARAGKADYSVHAAA